MPRLANLNGIIIAMYFADHNPPHVHVTFSDEEALVAIATGDVIMGRIASKQLVTARAWIAENRDELLLKWEAWQT